MSEQARPWWASDGADPGPEPDEDPLERHRAARRGEAAPDASALWDAAAAGASVLADRVAEAARDHQRTRPPGTQGDGSSDEDPEPDVCGVCPICTGLRTLHAARPELADHLTEAARHLAAAVRDLLEDPPVGPRDHDGVPPDDLERIDLD